MSRNDSGDIDAVYLWVEGQDDTFRRQLHATLTSRQHPVHSDTGDHRFRDNGELRYSLRSLEQHAPWIRRIYIVTNGQWPGWLQESSRVHVITHDMLFQQPGCLPTFNSTAIELQLHRIPGLSRYFLYFNLRLSVSGS